MIKYNIWSNMWQNAIIIFFFFFAPTLTFLFLSLRLFMAYFYFFVNITRKENVFTLQKSTAYIFIYSANLARKIIGVLEKKYALKYILHQNKFHYFLIYIFLHKSSNMIIFIELLTLYLIKISYKSVIKLCFIITF